jgi:hypothetical protein
VSVGTDGGGNRPLGADEASNRAARDSSTFPRKTMKRNDAKFPSVPALLSILLFAVGLYLFFANRDNKTKRVAVLVLGDIGRSPRMQNHAVSFARAGWDVDLVGFRGTSQMTTA